QLFVKMFLDGSSVLHQQLVEALPLSDVHDVIHLLQPEGDLSLAVEVNALLSDIKKTMQLKGMIDLNDVRLSLPQNDRALEGVYGHLEFNQDSLQAKDIKFHLMGKPATADISFQKSRSPQLSIQWQST